MRSRSCALLIVSLLSACGGPAGPGPAVAPDPSASIALAQPGEAPRPDAPVDPSAADVDPGSADLTVAPDVVTRAWTGDLDGMIERRVIRALVPYSKTTYFLDLGGAQRGISYEYMKAFDDDLNARLKTGNLRVHVVFVPTTRDRMLELLDNGRGDIAVVDATISAERLYPGFAGEQVG